MIDPNNLTATAVQTFTDDFDSLSLWNGTSGTWMTCYITADPLGNGCSLPSNGEQEWYINSNYGPTSSIKPWTVIGSLLTLTAQSADPSIKAYLGYSAPNLPPLGSYLYTSGMIQSSKSFSQTYGYFEVRAKLPKGQGLWPAFWLLPMDMSWPPELDVIEVLGKDMLTLYTTVHTDDADAPRFGHASICPDLSLDFHRYGMQWEKDFVTFYFDGWQVYQQPTPSDCHKPMYLIANLAVGGTWGGNADDTTPFPAQMQIDYIKAYKDIALPVPIQEPVASTIDPTILITMCYIRYLNRAPDAVGLQGWLDRLSSGVTLDQMIQGFINSPEYQAQQQPIALPPKAP